MDYRLVSFPVVAKGLLPLSLPKPDAINACGYLLPKTGGGSYYEYSPLDLLVAGLEAGLMGFFCLDLAHFFESRSVILSESKIYLTVIEYDSKKYYHDSILGFKALIQFSGNSELLKVLKRNAPWTFRKVL